MPVTVVPSSQQSAKKKSTSSRKRRQNQNEEVHELASLVPLSSSQLSGLIPSNGGKPQTISVLRLTTTFLKLQSFIKDASSVSDRSREHVSLGRMEEAIDGFLIVLDKDANILYVSETIAGHVGLIQQDVIGQNLADITHPEFSSTIADSLKPSLVVSTSVMDDFVVTQHRQFFVRLKPAVSYSTSPSHCIVRVCGNLKVQLSPSKTTNSGQLEFIEPTVLGFIGECCVVESVASILEISIPHSSFIITRTLDMKKTISIEAAVRDILGYEPEVFCADNFAAINFIHPADQYKMITHIPMVESMMVNGHAVSPFLRFMTGYGEWVWQQVEITLRNRDGTSTPHFWEIKIRVLGQQGGSLKYIEQRELCQSTCTKEKPKSTHNGCNSTVPAFTSSSSNESQTEDTAKLIIDSLKSTHMPESLHDLSPAVTNYCELTKQMLFENMTGKKGAIWYDKPTQRHFLSTTSDSGLSSLSTTAQSSPTALSSSSQISSEIQCSHSPCTPSSVMQAGVDSGLSSVSMIAHSSPTALSAYSSSSQISSPNIHSGSPYAPSSVVQVDNIPFSDNIAHQCMPVSQIVSADDSFTQGHLIPQQHAQQEFTMEAYPSPSCNSAISTTDMISSTATRLHSASSTCSIDSIPSAALTPFQDPNFIPQASQNHFNPEIPSTFDFSNTTISTSPFQVSSTQISPTNSISTSTAQEFNSLRSVSGIASLVQHTVGETMDNSDVNMLASLTDSANSMYSPSESYPQSNFSVPDSTCSAQIHDSSTFCSPAHLNADFTSQVLNCVDSESSKFYTLSSPEVQDILQQFM